MTDIPQEVREAAWPIMKHLFVQTGESESHWRDAAMRGDWDDHYIYKTLYAMFLAGKRAGLVEGMERAAEIADEWCADCSSIETDWDDGYYQASAGLAQAIRSENDG